MSRNSLRRSRQCVFGFSSRVIKGVKLWSLYYCGYTQTSSSRHKCYDAPSTECSVPVLRSSKRSRLKPKWQMCVLEGYKSRIRLLVASIPLHFVPLPRNLLDARSGKPLELRVSSRMRKSWLASDATSGHASGSQNKMPMKLGGRASPFAQTRIFSPV